MRPKVCFIFLFLLIISIRAFRAYSTRLSLFIPASIIVRVGGVKIIPLHTANLTATIENQNIAVLTPEKNKLLLKGLAPGNTRIQFESSDLIRYTKVYVKAPAGEAPGNLSIQVTGTRIPGTVLRSMVIQNLKEKINHEPGTNVSMTIPRSAIPPSFVQGCALTIPVKYKISGKDYIPEKGKFLVTIIDRPVRLSDAAHLMVSNNPESFTRPTMLFKAPFPDSSPARVFYHHYNKGNVPYRFVLLLTNIDAGKAAVHVLEGVAGPDLHEISVGAEATERFFLAERNHLGQVVEIGEGKSLKLLSIFVRPKETISGIVELTPMSASRLAVETKIESLDGQSSETMAKEVGQKPKGVFEGPDITLNGEYTVGGNYAFITLGKQSVLSDIRTGKHDEGNYGAFYTIHVTMNNPTDEEKRVQISFMPQAGPAAGIFLVDESKLIKTAVVPAFEYHSLLKYKLSPHETKHVTIKTFAQGGSFYPVSLVVHPLDH